MTGKRNYLPHKSFFKNFFVLLGFITALFLVFAAYTYSSSRKALQHEFLSYSRQQTARIANDVDDYMLSMRYIMASLHNNSIVRTFFTMENPDALISSGSQRMLQQLNAYKNSYNSLDSIYLYSQEFQKIATSESNIYNASLYTDIDWIEQITPSEDPYLLFARKKNNHYPYLVCLAKTMENSAGLGCIVLNLDFSRLSTLSSFADLKTQHVYIVTDEGEILFRNGQKDIYEPLSTVAELKHFSADMSEKQELVNSQMPYIYTQYHSADYPWSYVLITDMTDYTKRLTGTRSLLLTFSFCLFLLSFVMVFFFVFRSTRPIRSIMQFLEDPGAISLKDIDNEESQEIIRRIMIYIQKSQNLSQELKKQLKLLNDAKFLALQSQINPHFLFNTLNMIRMIEIDSLGYEHEAPEMTLRLSKLLQYALESTDLVSLSTEFYYTQLFVDILDKRYQGKIHFQLTLKPEAEEIQIPKLIIQPLIENAVFHGLSNRYDAENHLEVTALVEHGVCLLTVKDNGIGMSQETLKQLKERISDTENPPSHSIGLHNVNLRMYLLYGNDFCLDIHSTPGEGTAISLRFPISE